jgi:phosphopantothenoylcysteine decarboxylase/phosphopantothenate--cysteine ligase
MSEARTGGSAPHVLLGVSGGIAAYKSAEIVRGLVEAGADVRVLMTPAATRFLAPLTLSVLSKHPVVADLWDPSSGAVDHVELARWADVLAIAPATADVIAKLAHGVGDDALTTYALAHRTALLLAPAMNTWMWSHPATVENLAVLGARGATVVQPDSGDLACGDVGPGRLAPPARIVAAILDATRVSHELDGRTILVTAGPTREPIDPVRFLSNRSSGRMGYALAREARRRGAAVVLVTGPVSLDAPPDVRVVRVERTAEMKEAVLAELPSADALVMAAAPADFTVAEEAPRKLKRELGPPELRLVPAPDILAAAAAARRPGQLHVANDVSRAGVGFDAAENEVVLLYAGGRDEPLPRASKTVVAGQILDRVASLIEEKWPKRAAGSTGA